MRLQVRMSRKLLNIQTSTLGNIYGDGETEREEKKRWLRREIVFNRLMDDK